MSLQQAYQQKELSSISAYLVQSTFLLLWPVES